MKEIWKDITGYEGLYLISNTGLVKSNQGRVRLMKFKTDKDGYLHIGLTKNRKQRTFRVHRIVAEMFLENPNKLPEVNHKDLNKQNNNSNNLEWIDSRKNKQHYHKDEKKNTGVLLIGKSYRAQFTVNRKLYYVGVFKTYEEALIKYNEAFEQKDNPEKLKQIIFKNRQKFPRHVFSK